jgi:CheY-like chemotaxis protein
LIVEDDPIQSDVLASLLGSKGYYVDIAGDGRQALRRICTGEFHVALIDYRMPEVDGLGLARVVRALGDTLDRPRLVALTSSPQDLGDGSADFDEVLSKPIVVDRLLQAIERGRSGKAVMDAAGPAAQSVPFTPVASAGTNADTALPSVGPHRRVLLVDDDADLLEFLRLTLTTRGFDVNVAEDGLEAIGRIGTNCYDVVVVDFNMPKLDGLAAAKIIYDLIDRRTRPRIVALTSTPESLIAQDPRWHLVLDDIVSKTSGLPAILSAIENCINYKAIRLEKPLAVFDLQSMLAVVQSGG